MKIQFAACLLLVCIFAVGCEDTRTEAEIDAAMQPETPEKWTEAEMQAQITPSPPGQMSEADKVVWHNGYYEAMKGKGFIESLDIHKKYIAEHGPMP